MRPRILAFIFVAWMVTLSASAAFAQATGSVKGVCKDVEGKPIVGATVEFLSDETGRKYTLKTDSKGAYFSLGIAPGKYKATLLQPDGKEIYHFNGFPVALDENVLDFDMKKEQAAQAAGQGVNAEALKKQQEANAKVTKENATIKELNQRLNQSADAMKAGDYDTAIHLMTEATTMDPTRGLLWYKLGDAQRGSVSKLTDATEKKTRLEAAATNYQKAIDLDQKTLDAQTTKKPEDVKRLAVYYANLGDALGREGKTEEAAKAYDQSTQMDPTTAGQNYYNLGAVLTNAGKADEANAAFDKSIAADPTRADSYYQKGVNLLGKATADKTGKVIPVPGTVEALNKYLELKPTGQYADSAKQLIESLGSTVEVSYGTTKKKPKK